MTDKNDLENASENEVVNNFVNGLENEVENAKNCISDVENALEKEQTFSENAATMDVENAPTMDEELEEKLDEEFPLEEEEDWEENEAADAFDFPNDELEEQDPLDEAINGEPEEKPIDEVIGDLTGDSVKNLELLEELGEIAMEKIDDSKAMLCSAISGESPARYASDKKLNKALLRAFANYMRSNQVKTPSPLGSLLLVLAMWGLPTLGAAFYDRNKAKKAIKKQAAQKAKKTAEGIEDLEIEGEAQSDTPNQLDYTHLKEYQENRRLFDIHKETGCYNRTPKGQFCKTSLATEKPSPEIQQMLDQGWSNVEIRAALYNE